MGILLMKSIISIILFFISFMEEKNCDAGTFYDKDTDECVICPEGMISTDGSTSCFKNCDAGSFYDEKTKECVVCPEGQVSSAGSTSCFPVKIINHLKKINLSKINQQTN